MHEMGNQSWYTTVTLWPKGNIAKLLPEQRTKGLQTEVTDQHYIKQRKEGYVIRHSKDDMA
jgi:hypothetical protein